MTPREYPLQAVVDALQTAAITADRSQQELAACRAAIAAAVAGLRADAAARRAEKGGE